MHRFNVYHTYRSVSGLASCRMSTIGDDNKGLNYASVRAAFTVVSSLYLLWFYLIADISNAVNFDA